MAQKFSKHHIAAGLFVALIFAPLCFHFLSGTSQVSTLERRALAPFPGGREIATAPIDAPDKITRWMEDHMGLRGRLIKLHAKITSELDLSDERNAVRADAGWLFLAADKALASHQGLNPFAPGEAARWIDGAKAIEEAACRKPFAILIAPNKHSIYSEFLSRHPRRSARPTRLETLAAMTRDAGLSLAAPTDELRGAKEEAQVYFRTDSHWTERGAYEGYRALMESLADKGLKADIVGLDQLEDAGEASQTGDLYNLLGVEPAPPETYRQWRLRDQGDPAHSERLIDYDWDAFEAMRWTSPSQDAPRLLVYGDSYFNALRPFLLQSFSTVTFVHHRLGEPPLEPLRLCDYDAVALQMVERFLAYGLVPGP